MVKDTRKKCFIICPIGDKDSKERMHSDRFYNSVLKPVIGTTHIVKRVDEDGKPGMIWDNIFEHLNEDDLVIADLTDLNANVMYELATRHCTGKPVIIFKSPMDGFLPFDIKTCNTIFYNFDYECVMFAQDELRKQLKDIDDSPKESVNNPIIAAAERSLIINNQQSDGSSGNMLNLVLSKLDDISYRLDATERNIEDDRAVKAANEMLRGGSYIIDDYSNKCKVKETLGSLLKQLESLERKQIEYRLEMEVRYTPYDEDIEEIENKIKRYRY